MPRNPSTAKRSADDELIEALERQLREIGEDLHDNLCQTLAGTSMIIETIGRAVAARKPVSSHALATLRNSLETAVAQTRSLSHRFNPRELSGAGLLAAFQELAQGNSNCEFVCEKPVFVADPKVALALLRIAQAALRDAFQRPGTRHVCIHLTEEKAGFCLAVEDDGSAASLGRDGAALDLRLMKRRARAVGGRVQAKHRRDGGTIVRCRIPAAKLQDVAKR
jgi:signal transduction histidine kinase